ncbi:MAG: deoxyribose-phosphate aldolase [Bacteroidota bacterium]
MNISELIDHTILTPDCSPADINRVCSEAMEHKFKAVCIPPYYVKTAANLLQDSFVKVATVIGYPMGYSATASKVEEIKRALDEGADEVDVMINLCAIKSNNWNYIANDIDTVTTAVHIKGKAVKIILETGMLSEDEIKRLCELCNKSKPDFVKTSTGLLGPGASTDAVQLLKGNLTDGIQIKASGGIRTHEQAREFVQLGATRIGSSSGVSLL